MSNTKMLKGNRFLANLLPIYSFIFKLTFVLINWFKKKLNIIISLTITFDMVLYLLTNVCFYLLLLSSTCLTPNFFFNSYSPFWRKISVQMGQWRIMKRREKLYGIVWTCLLKCIFHFIFLNQTPCGFHLAEMESFLEIDKTWNHQI